MTNLIVYIIHSKIYFEQLLMMSIIFFLEIILVYHNQQILTESYPLKPPVNENV